MLVVGSQQHRRYNRLSTRPLINNCPHRLQRCATTRCHPFDIAVMKTTAPSANSRNLSLLHVPSNSILVEVYAENVCIAICLRTSKTSLTHALVIKVSFVVVTGLLYKFKDNKHADSRVTARSLACSLKDTHVARPSTQVSRHRSPANQR